MKLQMKGFEPNASWTLSFWKRSEREKTNLSVLKAPYLLINENQVKKTVKNYTELQQKI